MLNLVILFVAFSGAVLLFAMLWKSRSLTLQNKALNEKIKQEMLPEILLESSINEIYIFDKNTLRFINVSKGALQNLGYTLDEIKQLTPYNIKPEFTKKKFTQVIEPLIKKQKSILIFYTDHQRKDGTVYPVEIHLQLIDINDVEEQFVAVILDITERKKAEEALRQNEEHFRNLLESTAAIPWELDLETWLFTYVGPQIESVSGFKPEEWYTENFWADHLHPDDKEKSMGFCSEATSRCEDHEFEYRFIRKDGETIWIRDAVQVVTDDGEPVKLRGFMFDVSRQKQDEEKHKEIESRLQEAQSIAQIGSWDLEIETNILQWSEETYRIFEVKESTENATYKDFVEIIHPDDREFVKKAFEESLERHFPYDIEHRLLMPDGRIKVVNERCETEYNEKGKAVRAYGTVQDITERKRTDEAIQTIASTVAHASGDKFYQELVRSMAEMFSADYAFIGLLDENDARKVNTYMVYAHGKISGNLSYELTGTPCANVIGNTVCAYPDNVQTLFPEDKLLVDMNVNSYIGLPLFSSDGKPIGLVVVLDSKPMNNTSHMSEVLKIFAARTEAELERSKSNETIQQLSLAVEQSPNIIIITDSNGKIEYVNPAFTTTTGYSKEEVINKDPSIIKSGEMPSEFYKELWTVIKSGETWSGFFHNRRKNGELYWDEAKISSIKNKQNEITHFLGVQSDVTNKRQLEQQLRRSQKMDALGKLTGGIAHDYNNMLNVILGYTDLLDTWVDDNASDNEKIKNHIAQIQKASKRGAKLTRKLLSFSRVNLTEPEEVNINQLLLDDKSMLSKSLTARINLEYKLDETTWPVYLDKGDLEDAILNICINAMHAMPDGGGLTITAANSFLSSVEAEAMNVDEGDYVKISLHDTGCGMDENTQNQIFDPFFTTKGDEGTGLGLTQVYGFIKRSKGAITIDSIPDSGTTISLYFPRLYLKSERDGNDSEKTSIKSGFETILVVDDEPALLEMSGEMLASKGYNILLAEGAEEAMEILKDNKVDLMFSDVVMPNMDGYELAAFVRNEYPQVKIQLASGYNEAQNRTDDDKYLSENLLNKPFSSSELFEVVRLRLDNQ